MLFSHALLWLVSLSLSGWLYLLLGRSGFWLARPTLDRAALPRHEMPDVVAVVPARKEAAYVGRSLRSLLAQELRLLRPLPDAWRNQQAQRRQLLHPVLFSERTRKVVRFLQRLG